MLIGVAMEINEHIDEAVKKIKYSLSDGLVAKSIIYYQSGRRMTGYVDNYNIDSRLPSSGCFIPHEPLNMVGEKMPWES